MSASNADNADPAVTVETEAASRKPGLIHYLKQHPKGFWFIFWGEFAERCSFYGMRAILVTYMATQLGFGEGNAITFFAFFTAACYVLPLIGGFVADNYLGKYNTIVWFSIPYILGHFVLGVESPLFLFIALGLLAMGAGVIKPNISTLMGLTYDQQRPGNELLRTQAFSIFYMSINIGAAISQFAIPPIKDEYGYAVAFMFPALLMAMAFLIFALGKRHYAQEVIERRKFSSQDYADMRAVLRKVGFVFLTVAFFWAVFDQTASTWILFGNAYQENFSLPILGEITPERIQGFNPVFIVIFLPFVAYLWTVLDRRGIKVRPTTKMAMGFFLTILCLVIMIIPAYMTGEIQEGESVVRTSLWWQALAYLILTLAEILISVTGLEMAFVVAPPRMKGFVTSLWLLTVFVGNLVLNAPLGQIYEDMHPGDYFLLLGGMMSGVLIVFFFIARDYNRLVARETAAAANIPPVPIHEGGPAPRTTSPPTSLTDLKE